MENIFLLFVTLSPCFISFILTVDSAICITDRIKNCCQDYKNVSGVCTACIGSFGQNCSIPCIYGYYGHGCRKRCNCSQKQICDRKRGCLFANDTYPSQDLKKGPDTKNIIQSMILTTCCVLIFIVLGIIFYLQKKCRKNGSNTGNDVIKSSSSGNTCLVEQEQEEYIYNDVRESQMIQKADFVPSEKYRMHDENRSKEIKMCKNSPWQHEEEWQASACSSSLDLTYYGKHTRCSDTYNRLQLKKIPTCTLPAKSCVNMNNYALMKPNIHMPLKNINSEKERYCKGDEYVVQTFRENATMTGFGVDQSRLFRPYSSVNYHRNVEKEENVINSGHSLGNL